jgi:hypothetical protein
MASYLSKAPDFGTYQPEVNAELYGKLLLKKEQDYQVGVQKVDKYLDYVSALPVASERERKYLQEKVDGITSELNKNVNVDWSNQSVQKLTTSHIKAISSDPTIQAAVQSASRLKNGMKNLQEDEDGTDGKSILNKQAYLDEYNNWLQNGELGKVFTGEYNKFLDPLDDFHKYYKDKKPNQQIIVKSAGYEYDENGNVKRDQNGKAIFNATYATQQFDMTTQKWEEINPQVVEDDFRNFISMNPQYQKQLEINAKYKYKSLGADETLSMLDSEIQKNIENKKLSLASTDIQLGTIAADSKQRPILEDRRKQIQSELEILQQEISPEARMQKLSALRNNPELVQSFREKLYQNDLLNSVAGRYSYKKEIDFNVYGSSPSEKAKNAFEEKYKAEMLKIAQSNARLAEKKEQRLADAAAQKQKAQYEKDAGVYGAVTLPGSTAELKKSDWLKFSQQSRELNAKVHESKQSYITDNYSQQFPDKFELDPTTYKLVPKKQYQEQFDKMYDAAKENYLNGRPVSQSDMDHFSEIIQDEKLSDLMYNKGKEYDELWKEELKKRPDVIASIQTLENLKNNPIPVRKGPGLKPYDYITKTDLDNFNIAKKEVEQYMQPFTGTFSSLNPFQAQPDPKKIEEIYRKYNLTFAKSQDISTFARDYLRESDKIESEKEQFLSNYVKASQVLANPVFIPLSNIDPVTGKKMTPKDMNNLVRPIVERGGGKIIGDERSIGYVQDPVTKKFNLAVQGANDDMELFEMTESEAKSFKVKSTATEDYIDKLLRLNTLPSGESSNTYSGEGTTRHTFMDAIPLTTLGGQEVRYHVKKVKGTYYVEFWKKDSRTAPDDPGTIIKDQNGVKIESSSPSLSDIKIAIKNFAESGSTATPARYYATSSDNETQQEEE